MARIARLIIYDTDDDLSMAKQLAQSMSEGVHEKGKIKIMIINLATNTFLNGMVQELIKEQEQDEEE